MRRVVIAVRSEVGISLLLLVLVVLLLFVVVVVIVVVVSASRGAHVLRQDRSNNLLSLSLLFGVLLGVRFGVLADEVDRIREGIVHFLFVLLAHLLADVFVLVHLSVDHAPNALYIRFKRGLRIDALLQNRVLLGKPLCVLHHLLDFFITQASRLLVDLDLSLLSRTATLLHFFSLPLRLLLDILQGKAAQLVVVLNERPLTFEDDEL